MTLRLHRLPGYIKDDAVRQMCSRFGEVVSVEREKSKCDVFEVETGVRLVKMVLSVDNIKCLPHVFSFRCGAKALVSVPGRPLLCLKCMSVGHMRKDCGADTGAKPVFAAPAPPTLSEGNAWQRGDAPPPSQEAVPVADVTVDAAPAEEATSVLESVEGFPASPDDEEPTPPPMPVVRPARGEKRHADEVDEVMDSFSKIPPNHFLYSMTGVTEVSNPFDALGLLADWKRVLSIFVCISYDFQK